MYIYHVHVHTQKKGGKYITSTPNRTSSIQLIHISLINTIISLLSAISHKDVWSSMTQSSLRTPHNTGCRCNNAIFFLTLPQKLSKDVYQSASVRPNFNDKY